MKPLAQSKLLFNNKCGCICDYGLLEKAMLWFSKSTLKKERAIYLYMRYPAVSIYKTKIHVHRLLMYYLEREIFDRSFHVHHIDGNVLNNNMFNLEKLSSKDYIQGHLKGKKQSKEFAKMRTNLSCLARYGHETKENRRKIW